MNTEEVIFNYDLKIDPQNLGPNMYDYIYKTINETSFVKKNMCVLSINDIDVLEVKVTNGQSDCIANLQINARCIVPEEGKIFNGYVTKVLEHHQLTVMSIENKIDVIVKGVVTKYLGEMVNVKISGMSFRDGKIICMGNFI
jgi:DNA-directed RNA polymerase subunit E'/Rpb7